MGFDFSPLELAAVCAAFAMGGFVKGLLAFGLPLVMVPILSMMLPVPTAVALVVWPVLLTNAWQMFQAGGVVIAFKRMWPLLASLLVTLAASAHLLVALDETVILIIAGVIVATFVALDLFGTTISIPPHQERSFALAAGFFGGLIGGITSFFGTPPLMYLHALNLDKNRFVQTAALILFSGGVVLMGSLGRLDVLGKDELTLSTLGMVPLIVGLFVGQLLRARIDQALFRRLVLLCLLGVAASMISRAVFS